MTSIPLPRDGDPGDIVAADLEMVEIDAWNQALDTLEAGITHAEDLLAGIARGGQPVDETPFLRSWEPPSGLGALPQDLLPRARAILLRQRQLSVQLGEASRTNRRHQHLTEAARDTTPTGAVYVDTSL